MCVEIRGILGYGFAHGNCRRGDGCQCACRGLAGDLQTRRVIDCGVRAEIVVGRGRSQILDNAVRGGHVRAYDGQLAGGCVGRDRHVDDAFGSQGIGKVIRVLSERFSGGYCRRNDDLRSAGSRLPCDGEIRGRVDRAAGVEDEVFCRASDEILIHGPGDGEGGSCAGEGKLTRGSVAGNRDAGGANRHASYPHGSRNVGCILRRCLVGAGRRDGDSAGAPRSGDGEAGRVLIDRAQRARGGAEIVGKGCFAQGRGRALWNRSDAGDRCRGFFFTINSSFTSSLFCR